jgi:hypothetical protein
MAIGQHQHADTQGDRLGAAREIGQTGERVEKWAIRRHDEGVILGVGIRRVNLPRGDDAVSRPDGVEALPFGALRRLS